MDREGPSLHDMLNDLEDRVIREQRQQWEFMERIYARMEQANQVNAPPNVPGNVPKVLAGGSRFERGDATSPELARGFRENVYGTDRHRNHHGNNDQFDGDRYNNRNDENVGEEY